VQASAGWLWLFTDSGEFRLAAIYNLPSWVSMQSATLHSAPMCDCFHRLRDGTLQRPVQLLRCSHPHAATYGTTDTTEPVQHLSIALEMGRQTVGIINLIVPADYALAEAHAQTLDTARGLFALAGECARLTAQTTGHLAREQRLTEVSIAISSALDLQVVLQNVVHLAVELVGAEVGDMGLLMADGEALTYPFFFNLPEKVVQARRQIPKGVGLFQHVFETGTSVLLDEYSAHPQAAPSLVAAGIHGIIVVPIVAGEERIGALGLYHMSPQKSFTQHDVVLAEAVGRQAGVAIQNARRYEAERQRVRALDALRATMNNFSSELDLERLLHRLVAQAVSLLGARSGELGLYDAQREDLCILAVYNRPASFVGQRLVLGEGAMGHVAITRQPLIIPNYRAWKGSSALFTTLQPETLLVMPLLVGPQLVGVISVSDDTTRHGFDAEEVQLSGLFVQQASIAIQNARLFEDARRRAEEAETLRKAGAVVASSLHHEESIELILEQLALVVPYDSASVQLLRDGMLEIVGGRGFTDRSVVLGMRFPLDGENPGQVVYQERRPHILADAPTLYSAFRVPPHSHIRSWMGVPLIFQDRLIGMLAVDSTRPNHFTSHHAHLVAAFADQVAIALENARLFAEVQQMAITDPLTGLHNRRHFFELAYREVERTRRYHSPLAAIMLDVDHFKRVNDKYGHDAGDEVLRAVARWCRINLRAVDIVGRYGGEEFVILLPATDLPRAQVVAEHLRQQLAQTSIIIGSRTLLVTASLGIATLEVGDSADLEKLLYRADQALLAAKRAGRNRLCTWDSLEPDELSFPERE
jgi:diguanylate cyclase (GGDEF)-like protein